MSKLVNCKTCGKEVAKGVKMCPNCGSKKNRNWFMRHKVLSIILGLVVIGSVSALSKDEPTKVTDNTSKPKTEAKVESKTEVKTEPKVEVKTEVKDNVPKEYKSALKKAETYSSSMHMSKASLYEQLTSENGEKFSKEASQYAIDNLVADYKQNALKKAKSYQDSMNMSKASILEQLTSENGEKFTKEEAKYAVDNLDK